MQQTKIKTIIFDLDGTILNTGRDILTSINLTLESFGYQPITYEKCLQYVGDGIDLFVERALGDSVYQDIYHKLDQNIVLQAIKVYKDNYSKHLFDTTKPYPGARETLAGLQNLKKVVISNKHYEYVLKMLQYFQLDSFFEIIMGGNSLENQKPHPEPIYYVLNKLQSNIQEMIIVGDTDKDIKAGQAAGIKTCAALYGMRPEKELLALEPDYLIREFGELLNLDIF